MSAEKLYITLTNNSKNSELSMNTSTFLGLEYFCGFSSSLDIHLRVTPGVTSIALCNVKYIPAEDDPTRLLFNSNRHSISKDSIVYINSNLVESVITYSGYNRQPYIQSMLLRSSEATNINFYKQQKYILQRSSIHGLGVHFSDFDGNPIFFHPDSQIHLTFVIKK